MRKIIAVTVLAGALAVPGLLASVASAALTNRPGGAITLAGVTDSGQRWGPGLGQLRSQLQRRNPHTGDNGQGGGNGGDSHATCTPVPTDGGGGGLPS